MNVADHANRVSLERFGSMQEPRLHSDAALEPTLATPYAFLAGITVCLAAGCFPELQ